MRIIFFGTPAFAAEVLQAVVKGGFDVVAVVTKPDRPQGRSKEPVPCAVKVLCEKLLPHVPVYQPEKVSTPEYHDILVGHKPDIFCVAAYGEIIKQQLLDVPPMGCVNVHASLLPRWRGAAPIQRCLMAGDTVSGVTIMKMVLKMDAGDILTSASVAIPPEMTAGELEKALAHLGGMKLVETLQRFQAGTATYTPQPLEGITMAKKVELEDAFIDWQGRGVDVHNIIRATTPEPGAWAFVDHKGTKKRLRLEGSSVVDATGAPGTIVVVEKDGVVVACGQGAVKIRSLQLEGKKMMHTEEFFRGVSPKDLSLVPKV